MAWRPLEKEPFLINSRTREDRRDEEYLVVKQLHPCPEGAKSKNPKGKVIHQYNILNKCWLLNTVCLS